MIYYSSIKTKLLPMVVSGWLPTSNLFLQPIGRCKLHDNFKSTSLLQSLIETYFLQDICWILSKSFSPRCLSTLQISFITERPQQICTKMWYWHKFSCRPNYKMLPIFTLLPINTIKVSNIPLTVLFTKISITDK